MAPVSTPHHITDDAYERLQSPDWCEKSLLPRPRGFRPAQYRSVGEALYASLPAGLGEGNAARQVFDPYMEKCGVCHYWEIECTCGTLIV